MLEVPALNVKFVVVVKSTELPEPRKVTALSPKFIARTEVPLDEKLPPSTIKSPVLNVPEATLMAEVVAT
jgi:hypothetical protein